MRFVKEFVEIEDIENNTSKYNSDLIAELYCNM